MITSRFFTDSAADWQTFSKVFGTSQHVLITFHQNPDGDALGSGLALYHYLVDNGHRATVVSPTEVPEYLAWLPGAEHVLDFENNQHTSAAKKAAENASVVFCLDHSDSKRLKGFEENVNKNTALKILIDHHEEPVSGYGDLIYWNVAASSTCELLYDLLSHWGGKISTASATCLYTGLMTDTGSFKYPGTTAAVHHIAAELIKLGVNTHQVHVNVFDNNTLERLRLLGFVLNQKLVCDFATASAYISLSEKELLEYHSKSGDTEGLVNYALSIKGIQMAAIFIEKEGMIKISFRSVGPFSVAELSRQHFNGGGHKNAAGGRSNDSLDQTIQKFLTIIKNNNPTIKQS